MFLCCYTHFQKLSTQKKMLIFGSQSELKKMQFIAELDGNMQICYGTANRAFMSRNMQKGQSFKIPAL